VRSGPNESWIARAGLGAKLSPMFTGLVETTGTVAVFARDGAAWRLEIISPNVASGVATGDSVAVNGCCLTVAAHGRDRLFFDVLEETRKLTNFSALMPGTAVNLERALAVGARLGGHFVTGHIDGTGTIETFEPRGPDHYLRIRGPTGCGRLLVTKGSVAVDGISLTVAEVAGDTFAVWLIPHTLATTNLGGRRAGELVNMELDLLAKHVAKLLGPRAN
jgi:riboflavin synthase